MKLKNLLPTIALALLSAFNSQFSILHAQTPSWLNFQGRMVVGGASFNGIGQFKFAIVNADGSVTFWSNDGSSANGGEPGNAVPLTLTNGLYSVLLGDTTLTNMTQPVNPGIFTNAATRLRVWFNDGTNGFERLTPDQPLAATPYAMYASAANSANSVPAQNLTG